MKTKENKLSSIWSALVSFLIILLLIPSNASSEEVYKFEKMWPTHEQNWHFYSPYCIAIDGSGNVYVADTNNHRIQKLTSDGQLIASWGRKGSGDGEFYFPRGIATDGSGRVYVLDSGNYRIQIFNADGQYVAQWTSDELGVNGITLDSSGNIYVTNEGFNRVEVYSPDGTLLNSWGKEGTANGEFSVPNGIAIDSEGNVYVVDGGHFYPEGGNHRIQKFKSDGTFITKWGSNGSGDGEFKYPVGIAIDRSGNVYVADQENFRIQKFNSDGVFISELKHTEFHVPQGVAIDANSNIYVANTGADRINKFTPDGTLTGSWGSGSATEGEFFHPKGITLDHVGNVYVADHRNNRIQKFTPDGQFIETWGSETVGWWPTGIGIDTKGNVYVLDREGNRITKLNPDGELITSWGDHGSDDGEFAWALGIAIDGADNVYVADGGNQRIQKFSSDGQFITQWGARGLGDGEFTGPYGIAIDGIGNVYVVDCSNHRIQKFTSDGTFITKWGTRGFGDGEFVGPYGIAIDSNGRVYVADTDNHRIQVFTPDGQFITKFGEPGFGQGGLSGPEYLCVSPAGKVYVSDTHNNRIQVFSTEGVPEDPENIQKAIIVAGGGPFPGNNLWNATQVCANFAYRTLTYQGYNKDRIYYLSADTALDLDGNGILDDVDSDATNSNFHKAITDWAKDAKDLFIYIVDHGGEGTFRMRAAELLYASDLDGWLDSLQEVISGKVVLVYDACRSGSFIPLLTPDSGKERIVVSSSAWDQESIFAVQGKISFSFIFWASLFNGSSFYDSFVAANTTVGLTYPQSPQLDANGNGIGNEKADKTIAQAVKISSEILTGGDLPHIDEVSPSKTLAGERSALIYAKDVVDADGISRVWAVITPPGYSSDSPETPVTDLPMVDLSSVGNDRYEATYRGFVTQGTYNIAIFAADTKGILGLPQQTEVIQTKQVYQETAPDSYEDDDSYSQANAIVLNDENPQNHTFHDAGDQDWVKFYGLSGETYTIEASDLGSSCDAVIELYGMDGKTLLSSKDDGLTGEDEILDWLCPAEGVYYVKVKHYDPFIFGANTEYDLEVYVPIAPLTGFIAGTVTNAYSLEPIEGVRIKTGGKITALSFTDGNYLMVHPAGTYAIAVEASGYGKFQDTVTVGEGGTVTKNIAMVPSTGTVATPTFSPVSGTYNSAQSVVISCTTPGATIHYTTDGSKPTESSSPYSAPIDVSVTTTIKAKAFKTGWASSATGTATYTIILDSDSDGMPDVWEDQYGLNPLFDDSLDDADGDGFSNLREYQFGTDADNADSHPPRAMPWLPLLLGED